MTTGTIQQDLRTFTSRLLEHCGGIVEWAADEPQGTAVVPGEIAELLNMPGESFVLSADSGRAGLAVSLASDFLDVAGAVLAARVPRVGSFAVEDRYLKRGELQESIEKIFTWHNARVRVDRAEPAVIEYHTWQFHAALRSDDVWEGRLGLTLNSRTLVEVDLPDPFAEHDLRPAEPALAAPSVTFERAVALAKRRLPAQAGAFIARTDERLRRDRQRLHDYYGALAREARTPSRRARTPPSAEEIAARERAVQLELRRKLAELDERYALEAVLRPIVLLRTQLPTLAVELDVQRKQARRRHTVYWNPLTKRYEPLGCSRCHAGTYSAGFTNDDVAPLCSGCLKETRRN